MSIKIGEIQSSEENSRNIADAVPVAIVMIDASNAIVLVNSEAEELFDYSRQEMVGNPVDLLIPGILPNESLALSWNGSTPLAKHRQGVALRKDGIEFPVEMRLCVTEHEGRSLLVIALSDITHWVELQDQLSARTIELERSMDEYTEFSYVVSHDLQEPLRKIVSSCQALVEDHADTLDLNKRRWIDFAVDGAQRMQRMVTDLLSLSRVITKGRALAPVNATKALQQALDSMRVAIDEASAQLVVQPLPCVLADESQLSELFGNLISNAIKYRQAGELCIEIGIDSSLPTPPERCIFFVRDNGIGIAPEHFERIFVVFQRLHRRGEYSGNGIGLAVSKKIVQRHGGRVWVQACPGQGSTFYFTLAKSAAVVH